MSKKYLRKNEFRIDYNIKHFGKNEKPHPAYISARLGHKYKANLITHSRKTTDGFNTYDVHENPNKLSKDKRQTRISPPFWQNENQFGEKKGKASKNLRRKIVNYNKKFYK